jgi:hypothetical protein
MLTLTLILPSAPALEDTAHQRALDSCTSEKVAGGLRRTMELEGMLEKGAGGGRWRRALEEGRRAPEEKLEKGAAEGTGRESWRRVFEERAGGAGEGSNT